MHVQHRTPLLERTEAGTKRKKNVRKVVVPLKAGEGAGVTNLNGNPPPTTISETGFEVDAHFFSGKN